MPYGGPELLLVGWLPTQVAARVGTDVPAGLAESVPFVQVLRIGGPDDDSDYTFDKPTVSVDCFAADRVAANTLAVQVHKAMRSALRGVTTGGATVSAVHTISGMAWRPWDDLQVRRFGATYQLFLKS